MKIAKLTLLLSLISFAFLDSGYTFAAPFDVASVTDEQALAAFKEHENVDSSFQSTESGKNVIAAWKDVRHALFKNSEENEKRRIVLGKTFLIAKNTSGNIFKCFVDLYATTSGTEFDPKNGPQIIANMQKTADSYAKSKDGFALTFLSLMIESKAFGSNHLNMSDEALQAFKRGEFSVGASKEKKPE